MVHRVRDEEVEPERVAQRRQDALVGQEDELEHQPVATQSATTGTMTMSRHMPPEADPVVGEGRGRREAQQHAAGDHEAAIHSDAWTERWKSGSSSRRVKLSSPMKSAVEPMRQSVNE